MLTRLRTWLARFIFSRVRLYEGIDLFDAHPDVYVKTSDRWVYEPNEATRLFIRGPVAGRMVHLTVTLTVEQTKALYPQITEAMAAAYVKEHG